MSDTVYFLLEELEHAINGDAELPQLELESTKKQLNYSCSIGLHKWKLYVGLTDRFYYCEECDTKRDYWDKPK